MVFHKDIRAYRFNPDLLVSSAPESHLYSSSTRKLRRLPQRGVDLYRALAAKHCVVSGAFIPKVVLELERTANVLNVWTTGPPGRSSLLRWCTQ